MPRLSLAEGFAALALVLFFAPFACSDAHKTPPFARFEAKKLMYGYTMDGHPPDRLGVHIILLDRELGCEGPLPPDAIQESVHLRLSGHQLGTYSIQHHGLNQYGQEVFEAAANHRQDVAGDDFKYIFPEGTFELEELTHFWPDLDDEISEPSRLRGTLDIYAPLDPYGIGECSGGSGTSTICTCTRRDGSTTTCIPEKDEKDCCMVQTHEYWHIQRKLDAEFCPYICEATSLALFTEYCKPAPKK